MGFLRLITNRHVMGADVCSQKHAWQIYDVLARDERVVFLKEPPNIDNEWRRLTQGGSASTNTWTDAYLAAFALSSGGKIVSFDQGFKKLLDDNALLL